MAVTLVLTENEKRHLAATGDKSSTLSYCRPCHKTLSDRQAGAQLMKGALLHRLRAYHVSNAEQTAQQFFDLLTKDIPNGK